MAWSNIDLEMCDICSRYFDGANGLIIHKYNYHHREIIIKGIYLRGKLTNNSIRAYHQRFSRL
jgi:hypothetical protein